MVVQIEFRFGPDLMRLAAVSDLGQHSMFSFMFVTLAQIIVCVVQGFVGFAVSMLVIENLNVNHFLVEALRLRGGPLRRAVNSSAVFCEISGAFFRQRLCAAAAWLQQ